MAKIILVEDDATMLSLLSTLLEMEGFQVASSQGQELEQVFEFIRRERPALALVDVNLRQFSGFDLLHRIREDELLRDMRVMMTSGMDYTERCVQEGADDFMLKPYMPDDLISKIRQILSPERN